MTDRNHATRAEYSQRAGDPRRIEEHERKEWYKARISPTTQNPRERMACPKGELKREVGSKRGTGHSLAKNERSSEVRKNFFWWLGYRT